MRLILPILLLTTAAALAQSQPAPAEKPFIYDALPRLNLNSKPKAAAPVADKPYLDDRRTDLCPFQPPGPVTIGPGPSNTRTPTPQTNTLNDCGKPDAPRTPAKGVG